MGRNPGHDPYIIGIEVHRAGFFLVQFAKAAGCEPHVYASQVLGGRQHLRVHLVRPAALLHAFVHQIE